eukprot:12105706-Prorocentrum_lima.AAC.1
MTSSLVGSEMCIRDRRLDACIRRTRFPPADHQNTPSPTLAASPAKEEKAVSYTHLTLPTICSV